MPNYLPPLLIFLAFGLYGVIHSIMAALWFKDWLNRTFGEISKRYYRLFYSVFSTLTLLPILAMPVLLPDQTLWSIPAGWRIVTAGIQLLSVVALGLSVLQSGALQFVGLAQAMGMKNANESLNTGGLYRFIRHPLYTFSMLFLWLTPTMTINLASLYGVISLYFIVGAIVEERKLVTIFGQAYRDYQDSTPMFIPHPFK